MSRFRWMAASAFAAWLCGSSCYALDAAVIGAAKKEGEVSWYSTQIINQLVRPMAAAFEKKYPGIKVHYTRGNAAELGLKIFSESRARNVQVDVFEGVSKRLVKEGYVLQWQPDAAKIFPALYKDPDGYWVAENLYVNTPGYNTSLITPGTQPKTYQDLLDPKWHGKLAWNGTASAASAGAGFIGNVLASFGEEKGMAYLRELAKQKIVPVSGTAREVLDQVIAGEYAIGLQIFNHHAVISAKKGAPVDWIKLEPATGTVSTVSIHSAAPHPNAAKLLVEFILSKEGQEIFRDADYIPASPEVAAPDPALKPDPVNFKVNFYTPEQIEEAAPKWKQVLEDLFR